MQIPFNDLNVADTLILTREEFEAKKLSLEFTSLALVDAIPLVAEAVRTNQATLLPKPHEIEVQQAILPENIVDKLVIVIMDKNSYSLIGVVYTVFVMTENTVSKDVMLLYSEDDTQTFQVYDISNDDSNGLIH